MPQLGDFLNRFRPAGAPGAASRAGVPADRAAELSAELDPVLAMLAATDAECARLVAEAEQEAGRIAAQARDQAASIAADAVQRAERGPGPGGGRRCCRGRGSRPGRPSGRPPSRPRRRPGPSEDDVQALIQAAIELVRSMPDGDSLPDAGGNR